MCRLFGLIANKPVDLVYGFYQSPKSPLSRPDETNPHGWGIAWWRDKDGWKLYKEPIPLDKSPPAIEFVHRTVNGRIIISHIRYATIQSFTYGDTHPWLYKGWAFAHNGSIDRDSLLPLVMEEYQRDLEGSTDSELLFRLVIQESIESGDAITGIKRAVDRIVGEEVPFTSLNFLASDGEKLYALRYVQVNEDHYNLFYTVKPMRGEVGGVSRVTRQIIRARLSPGEEAVLVASEALGNKEYWVSLDNKSLLVIDKKSLEPVVIGLD